MIISKEKIIKITTDDTIEAQCLIRKYTNKGYYVSSFSSPYGNCIMNVGVYEIVLIKEK